MIHPTLLIWTPVYIDSLSTCDYIPQLTFLCVKCPILCCVLRGTNVMNVTEGHQGWCKMEKMKKSILEG